MKADLVLTNASVYTVDPTRSRAEAVGVSDGRIVAVGAADEVERLIGPGTQVLDLARRLVLPGFIDAHMHTSQSCQPLYGAWLGGLTTIDDLLQAVARFAHAHPDLPAIRGFGWSTDLALQKRMTASELDAIVAHRPVVLTDDGYHLAWVNSAALLLGGFNAGTPDPDNGIIERLPTGKPSGVLVEGPAFVLDQLLPFSAAQMVDGLVHFGRKLAGPLGMTTVHDSAAYLGGGEADAYATYYGDGRANYRSAVAWWIFDDRPLADQIAAAVAGRDRLAGPLLKASTAKFFVDGVIEGHSALLAEPYSDRPGYSGKPIWQQEKLCAAATAAAQAGLQLHFHAIGDRAVTLALDAIEAARASGCAVARPLITHLQLVDPADIPRMAALGVVALMQPYWFDGVSEMVNWYGRSIGVERAANQYPMKSFWDNGVVVASASDYPVSPPPDPLIAIQKGVLRTITRPADPADALGHGECVTVEQMIESFTINGAYANFLEDETGSIEVGKAADLIVLSRDILTCAPEEITDAHVELTVFGGRVVHASAPFSGAARSADATDRPTAG
jgi:predicted amidohydrolase YtcJ